MVSGTQRLGDSEKKLRAPLTAGYCHCQMPSTLLKGVLALTILCTIQFSSAQITNEPEMDDMDVSRKRCLLLISLLQTEM